MGGKGSGGWNKGFGDYIKGEKNPFYGKKHTKETKKIIGKSSKGRKHSKELKLFWSKTRKGKDNANWRGGRIYDGSGYVLIHSPNHPHKMKLGYVYEHRLVMEKHLGRYLTPEELVHHINEILDDNRIENLMLFENSYKHLNYHKKIKREVEEVEG